MRWAYCMVFLSLVFSHQASAGFLGKYKDWRDSSLERKHGYVAGYIDHLSGHINGLAWYNARAKGINSCFLQMKIDTDMIIGAIDNDSVCLEKFVSEERRSR